MTTFITEMGNYINAGIQTALLSPYILLPPGDVENIHELGKSSISSSLLRLRLFPLFQLVSPLTSRKMTPGAPKFIIYRLTSQNIVGVGWGTEGGRERINDKQVYIMPKSAACNINGHEGEHSLSICLWECVCTCWSGVLERTWRGDFYSCHTRCFWGGAGLVPKRHVFCSRISSLTAGSDAPAAVLLLWSVSCKLLWL